MKTLRKYIPDLSRYATQCELNYVLVNRCLRLAEDASGLLEKALELNFELPMGDPDVEHLSIRVLDTAPYTTTLDIGLELTEHPLIEPVKFKVRLYHDVQMAEIIETHRNHAPCHNHRYPEQVKFYPDDKWQRNRLLNQCLRQCLDYGKGLVVKSAAVV